MKWQPRWTISRMSKLLAEILAGLITISLSDGNGSNALNVDEIETEAINSDVSIKVLWKNVKVVLRFYIWPTVQVSTSYIYIYIYICIYIYIYIYIYIWSSKTYIYIYNVVKPRVRPIYQGFTKRIISPIFSWLSSKWNQGRFVWLCGLYCFKFTLLTVSRIIA